MAIKEQNYNQQRYDYQIIQIVNQSNVKVHILTHTSYNKEISLP